MGQVTEIEKTQRVSLIETMARRYNMDPSPFQATVIKTCMPGGKAVTNEQFAAFLLVANEHGLNPVLKEIYAFPAKGGGIQPIVSVDGWANLINSHPQFDGLAFEDHLDEDGEMTAITCSMFRKDRSHAVSATEYMKECKRGTDPWKQWPRRMLRHKAMIQAARYAFGFAGIYDPDEGERIAGDTARDVTPPPPPEQSHDVVENSPDDAPAAPPASRRPGPARNEDGEPITGFEYALQDVEVADNAPLDPEEWLAKYAEALRECEEPAELEEVIEANASMRDLYPEEIKERSADIEQANRERISKARGES